MFVAVFFLLIVYTLFCSCEQFGCYPEYSPNHVGCLPDTGWACRRKMASGVSQADRSLIVKFHNKIRTQFALGTSSVTVRTSTKPRVFDLSFFSPSASNMAEMASTTVVLDFNIEQLHQHHS